MFLMIGEEKNIQKMRHKFDIPKHIWIFATSRF